jgi:putative ABC transport system permease protein
MFKNYLLVAWRNLSRRIGLSFISIFGLALGIACFSFFLLYALNEFSFDGFHQHSSDIYRVYRGTSVWQGSEQKGGIFTPMPLGPTMKHDFPDVVQYVRYIQSFDTYLKIGNVPEREDLAFVDPSFFSVFSFKLRSGDPQSALADLHSIVLTESTAKRLFGMTDVIGKSVQLKVLDNNFENFTVTAVE